MNNSKTEKELMFKLVEVKYGDRLDSEQLAAIKTRIDRIMAVIDEIRAVPLENGDEPFNVFKPYRRD
ncbi:hypothetical protein ACFL0D_07020 [Thermoproteota archaeon]